jgi:hypothetical protein
MELKNGRDLQDLGSGVAYRNLKAVDLNAIKAIAPSEIVPLAATGSLGEAGMPGERPPSHGVAYATAGAVIAIVIGLLIRFLLRKR